VAPRSENPKLIIRVVNFELVQPICSRYINVTDGHQQADRQTDIRTDRRTTYDSNIALAVRASRGNITLYRPWPQSQRTSYPYCQFQQIDWRRQRLTERRKKSVFSIFIRKVHKTKQQKAQKAKKLETDKQRDRQTYIQIKINDCFTPFFVAEDAYSRSFCEFLLWLMWVPFYRWTKWD